MPFDVPDLSAVRRLNRDNITAFLPGADATVPNAALRVLSDQNAGGAYLNLLYLDYLAKNLLPDRAEAAWLDRWADILFGGRKAATFAGGTVLVSGTQGVVLPKGSLFATTDGIQYQSSNDAILSASVQSPVTVEALTAGAIGNRNLGTPLALTVAIAGIAAQAVVELIDGGADAEGDDDLRTRVLLRIRETPMGGDRTDYEQWTLSVAGVTRAWVAPMEMGVGTVTVRFLCDSLRASNGGFPTDDDVAMVKAYLDTVRPVTVADLFVVKPIAQPLLPRVLNLSNDTSSMRLAIAASVKAMLVERAAPGQTIFAAWMSAAVSDAVGDGSFDLVFDDAVMPSLGHMATLYRGGIAYS